MGEYPTDFPVPQDQGGPGAGSPVGGFGGNPTADRTAHRTVVARTGKAPVLLVHGNGGAADVQPWDMLDLTRMLLAAGYPPELIWAPSYLGPGTVGLFTPHTDNINDVREYLEAVCSYLGVDVVDVIAHSLGCTLMYAVFRGLDHRSAPIGWNQPKKWNRVGTFVALAGAFHGLGAASVGEWITGGEFMNELLAETVGGGGTETPYRTGTSLTPPPLPLAITYFCGIAIGDSCRRAEPRHRQPGRCDEHGLRPRVRHHRSPENQGERRRLQGFPALAELRGAGAQPAVDAQRNAPKPLDAMVVPAVGLVA